MALSGSIRTARVEAEYPDLNSIGVTVRFKLQSDDAARQLRALLKELKPFLDTVLAGSGMKADYAAAGTGSDVTVQGTLSGARLPLTRLVLRHLR